MTIKIPDHWESFSIEEITLRKSLLVAHVNSFDQNDDHFHKVKMILTFLGLRKTYLSKTITITTFLSKTITITTH